MTDLNYLKLNIKRRYRNGPDNIGRDLVAPCLKNSIQYRRGTGFFSSGALISYVESLDSLIREETKIEIICSPVVQDKTLLQVLKQNLSDEQRQHTLSKLADSVFLTALGYKLNPQRRDYKRDLLAYFIAKRIITIKFAIPRNGDAILSGEDLSQLNHSSSLYHVKTGYFKLKDGSIVAFDGSFNESDSGHHYHIDQTQVWRSWEPGDQERLQDIVENIDDDWCGNNRYIHLFPMSKEALDLAERLSPRERPRVRDYTIERLPVAPSSSPPRLRDYQEVSLQRWKEAGFKGIISLATGTGKTRVAIEAIKRFNQKYVNGLAVVTVPYQPLAAQWINELNSQGIATLKVYESSDNWMRRLDSIVDSYVRGAISGGAPVLVCVNKSFLDEAFQSLMRRMDNSSEKKIFIADECHHLNRKNTIEQLPDSFDFRLGLSATPYDRNEPRFLQKYFGEIVAEYLLKDAIRDGYLTPYYYFPIFVQFSEEEASRYIEIAEQIGGRFTDENERYAILESSEELNAIAENVLAKVIELERLLVNQGRSAHSLFYCGAGSVSFPDGSRVRQIHMVTSLLARLRWSVNQITADENQSDRENIIRHFDRKSIDAIASIRILDEGIDVPNCSQAFILASQRSDRQGIQRRGRLLRIAPGKKHASLYDFILTGPRHSSRDLDRFYEREIRRARMFANDAINYNECNSRIDTEIR